MRMFVAAQPLYPTTNQRQPFAHSTHPPSSSFALSLSLSLFLSEIFALYPSHSLPFLTLLSPPSFPLAPPQEFFPEHVDGASVAAELKELKAANKRARDEAEAAKKQEYRAKNRAKKAVRALRKALCP